MFGLVNGDTPSLFSQLESTEAWSPELKARWPAITVGLVSSNGYTPKSLDGVAKIHGNSY